MFLLGVCNDSRIYFSILVLIRTYVDMRAYLLFLLYLLLLFFAFVLAFSAFVLICFVLVLSSEFVSKMSSVAFFTIPPAFLFCFAFCGADHSSKSLTSPQYFSEFNRAVKKAPTVMS